MAPTAVSMAPYAVITSTGRSGASARDLASNARPIVDLRAISQVGHEGVERVRLQQAQGLGALDPHATASREAAVPETLGVGLGHLRVIVDDEDARAHRPALTSPGGTG